jgi:hypothetical protein
MIPLCYAFACLCMTACPAALSLRGTRVADSISSTLSDPWESDVGIDQNSKAFRH